MWTGDNLGTWEHMAVGVKMVLANGLGGLSFAGCEYHLLGLPSINLTLHLSRRWRILREPRAGDARALVPGRRVRALLPRSCTHRHKAP